MFRENFEQPTGAGEDKKGPGIKEHLQYAFLGGAGAFMMFGHMFFLEGKNGNLEPAKPPHPEGPFEFVSTDGKKVTLRQEGKNYIVNTSDLTPEAKKRISETYPQFKSFIESGPIHITDNTEKR